jgi:hypothetical protein
MIRKATFQFIMDPIREMNRNKNYKGKFHSWPYLHCCNLQAWEKFRSTRSCSSTFKLKPIRFYKVLLLIVTSAKSRERCYGTWAYATKTQGICQFHDPWPPINSSYPRLSSTNQGWRRIKEAKFQHNPLLQALRRRMRCTNLGCNFCVHEAHDLPWSVASGRARHRHEQHRLRLARPL